MSRECAVADIAKSHFVEVGYTDFSGLVPGRTKENLKGAVEFTVSLCGKFVVVTQDKVAYIYELNHMCSQERSRWSIPTQLREGLSLGLLRPVSVIRCPRRILCCSMDLSAGRNSAAFLMDGRSGLVADISAKKLGPALTYLRRRSSLSSFVGTSSRRSSLMGLSKSCICTRRSVVRPLSFEGGSRSIYTGICHADDPPRSIALCPQRNCVAFGSESGIELN